MKEFIFRRVGFLVIDPRGIGEKRMVERRVGLRRTKAIGFTSWGTSTKPDFFRLLVTSPAVRSSSCILEEWLFLCPCTINYLNFLSYQSQSAAKARQ